MKKDEFYMRKGSGKRVARSQFFLPPSSPVRYSLQHARFAKFNSRVKQEIEPVKQVTKRSHKTVVVMNLERHLQTELHKLDRLATHCRGPWPVDKSLLATRHHLPPRFKRFTGF